MTINKEFQIIEIETRMFDTVLKILLFFSTLAYMPGQSLFIFEQKFFPFCVMILVMASFNAVKQREVNFNLLIGLNTVFLINTILHKFNPFVLAYTSNIFLLSLVVYIVASYTENFKSCIKWILASFVLSSAVLLLQLKGYSFFLSSLAEDSGGMMGNLPRLSFLACIAFPLALNSRLNWLFVPIVLASCLIVFPQYCLVAVIGLIVFIKSKRSLTKTLLLLLAVTVFVFVAVKKPDSVFLRLEYYTPIISDLFSKYLWTGFGAGKPFALDIGHRDMQIYSSILQFIFCTGISGAIWFCFMCNKFYRSFRVTALNLSIAGLLFISIWEYPFEVKRIWFLIGSLIGFLIIENKEKNQCINEKI